MDQRIRNNTALLNGLAARTSNAIARSGRCCSGSWRRTKKSLASGEGTISHRRSRRPSKSGKYPDAGKNNSQTTKPAIPPGSCYYIDADGLCEEGAFGIVTGLYAIFILTRFSRGFAYFDSIILAG